MSKIQRITLNCAFITLLLMFIFPPYLGIDKDSGGTIHAFVGYRPFWNPPSPVEVHEVLYNSKIQQPELVPERKYETHFNMVRFGFNFFSLGVVVLFIMVIFREPSMKVELK